MKWFLPFLGFIFIGELIEKFIKLAVIVNYLIGVIESIFYGYIFYHLSHRPVLKKTILFFVPISVAGYFITYFLCNKNFTDFVPNLIISGFFLAAIALLLWFLFF